MALSPGVRLGSYQILSPLGAGGMGEVYRGRDMKLDRDVAIKVLPRRLAEDPGALARFEREAKAVAALSHPNILAIYDFGEHEGSSYAVMELLEGETLRERLASGALPARRAVEIALQITQGLAAAHAQGITHRDLKPENIFLVRDGRVKILDFGLARHSAVGAASDATHTPTLARHTEPGTVMGTVGYMSPEQVRGQPADQRSDIFSLGAVLYEMLSGKRAFHGESAVETMSAILKEDPADLSQSGRPLPQGLDRILRHCLEKNPEQRFQSARDIAFDLEALSGLSSGARAVHPSEVSRRRWLLPASGIALLAAVAVASFLAGRGASSRTASGHHPSFRLLTFRPQAIFRAAFAPDGKTILFSAALKGNAPEIFSLAPEYPEPRPLGLKGAHLLSVSSKGELAVLAGARYIGHRLFTGTLARMPLGGGAPREILENVREAEWSPDSSGLAIIREAGGKDRLEYPIGKVLYETAGYVSDLRFSPAGDRIAFLDHPTKFDDRGDVAVVDLSGKRSVLDGGYWGEEGLAWSRDGKEVLFSAGTSYSSFRIHAATLAGEKRIALESAGGLTLHDISKEGQWLVTRDDQRRDILARTPGTEAERDLSWLDLSDIVGLSPDGNTLLFTEQNGIFGNNYAVCLRKTDGSPVIHLGEGWAADLSPDGRWALSVIPTSPDQLLLYPTGAGEPLRLERGRMEHYTSARWFPDGRRVLICGNEIGRAVRCYIQEIAGGGPREVTPEGTTQGFVSPDGERILVRGMGGELVIFPVGGGHSTSVPSSAPGDSLVRWSADGRALFVHRWEEVPAKIERIDLSTGRRDLVRQIAPPDLAGVLRIDGVSLADDGISYAYSFKEVISHLFLVEGVR